MKTKTKATIKSGSKVLTKWDDGKFSGTVVGSYRGHRKQMYKLTMDDGGYETISADQIIKVLHPRK